MGKKGHWTFKNGHLIFGGGCVRTPRTPSDTPLFNHSVESHFTIYHSVSFSSQWSIPIKKRYKSIKEEKISKRSKQVSITMKKISEYKVQKRCDALRFTQVKFPKDSSHELTMVKILIPLSLLHMAPLGMLKHIETS